MVRVSQLFCRKWAGRRNAAGSITVVFVVSLVALIGAVGFVADVGHLFVNKTRLQSALDSVALSAAYALNSTGPTPCDAMLTAATATLNKIKAQSDNAELTDHLTNLTYEVAPTLTDAAFLVYPGATCPPSAGGPYRFVRVKAQLTGLRVFLLHVLQLFGGPTDVTKETAASAVAGPSSCPVDVMPAGLCGTPVAKDDPPCSGGSCYGIPTGVERCIKSGSAGGSKQSDLPDACFGTGLGAPGNFAWLRTGKSGAPPLEAALRSATGSGSCAPTWSLTTTETGNVTSVADAFNSRFGFKESPPKGWPNTLTYPPSFNSAQPNEEAGQTCARGDLYFCPPGATKCNPPPDVTDTQIPGNTDSCISYRYSIWKDGNAQKNEYQVQNVQSGLYAKYIGKYSGADETNSKRIVAFPVIDCSTLSGGISDVKEIGYVCAFLTRPMAHVGSDAYLMAEITGDCNKPGQHTYTPIRIMLYKDPGRGDS